MKNKILYQACEDSAQMSTGWTVEGVGK